MFFVIYFFILRLFSFNYPFQLSDMLYSWRSENGKYEGNRMRKRRNKKASRMLELCERKRNEQSQGGEWSMRWRRKVNRKNRTMLIYSHFSFLYYVGNYCNCYFSFWFKFIKILYSIFADCGFVIAMKQKIWRGWDFHYSYNNFSRLLSLATNQTD